MAKLIDLKGKRFERLVVLERMENSKTGQSRWLCHCDCGTELTVQGSNLRENTTRSCGCLRREVMAGIGRNNLSANTNVNTLRSVYKRNATLHGLTWGLTDGEFENLVKSPCYYHGEAPSRMFPKSNRSGVLVYNGIDRLDNALGYVTENAVPACWDCNRMKGGMSAFEFREHITKIYNFSKTAQAAVGGQ